MVFLWVMLAFVGLAFLEATIEGERGGGAGTFGGQRSIFGYKIRMYHFWLWYVVVPLLVFSPLLVVGLDLSLFGTLAVAYLLGGVLEDFLYFVVNPYFGVRKWNSKDATWMPWFKLGTFEIPQFYVRNFLASIVVWFLFVR